MTDARSLATSLYAVGRNQTHCEAWIVEQMNQADLHRVLSRVGKLDTNTFHFKRERHDEIIEWGRRQLVMLGYEPVEFSKTD